MTEPTAKRPHPLLRLVLEVGPLVTFFVVNARASSWDLGELALFRDMSDGNQAIMAATAGFMIATAVSLTVSLALFRRVPLMPLISGGIVLIFGGLTLYLQDDLFIKIKPTIVNLIFATLLIGGMLVLRRPLLGYVLESVMALSDEGWRKLSWRWGFFFVFLALLNEIVWRNFSTDFWVTFKVFGIMPLTIVFTLTQVPLIQRYHLDAEADASS